MNFVHNLATLKEIGLPWIPKATNHNEAKSEDSKLHKLKGET